MSQNLVDEKLMVWSSLKQIPVYVGYADLWIDMYVLPGSSCWFSSGDSASFKPQLSSGEWLYRDSTSLLTRSAQCFYSGLSANFSWNIFLPPANGGGPILLSEHELDSLPSSASTGLFPKFLQLHLSKPTEGCPHIMEGIIWKPRGSTCICQGRTKPKELLSDPIASLHGC